MSESGLYSPADDAVVDLLIKQATEGLSPAEQRELDLVDGARLHQELLAFERAVAGVTLAGLELTEPPLALQARLQTRAEEVLAPGKVVPMPRTGAAGPTPAARAALSQTAAGDTSSRVTATSVTASGRAERRASPSGNWGWVAAAACLLLAIFGWTRSPPVAVAPMPTVQLSPPSVAAPIEAPAAPAPPTPAEERAALLARADTLKVTLGATKDRSAVGVTGDAVWDPKSQRGFLHFVGLTGNDPAVRQYQIWLFDGQRDKRYPVDGGVFDVPAGASEVVIPIRAMLPIRQIAAFAVTVEQPGGAVVSSRAHVVALGAAG